MTETINTTTAPALPDEMVQRATEAMLHADGWTVQEIADQCKKGAGTTLRPFTAEILAEVALTAADMPQLLAEAERLRIEREALIKDLAFLGAERWDDGTLHVRYAELNKWFQSEGDKRLATAERERDEARAEVERLRSEVAWLDKQIVSDNQTELALKKEADAAEDRAYKAERDGREALEFKKAINSLMEAMRLFDKEWIGDNKGWGYAFERIKLLAVERNDAREALQRRDRLDEAELDGIAAALDGQGADSCSLSDPAERETWLLGYNSEAELLRLRRERDEAREALRIKIDFSLPLTSHHSH